MSSLRLPIDVMSVEDWDALPENEFLKKAELVEGVLELAPTPSVDHRGVSAHATES